MIAYEQLGALHDPEEAPPSPRRGLVGHLLIAAYLLLYAGCVLLVGAAFGLPVLYGLCCILAAQACGVIAWAVHRVRRAGDGDR